MQWYLKCLKQYVDFNGRARRKEYWMFVLFNIIFIAVATILDNVLGLAFYPLPCGPLYLIYMISVLAPSLAVVVRRLHDVGKSGWFILISIIPIIGWIWMLYLMISDGEEGANEYGDNPKEIY